MKCDRVWRGARLATMAAGQPGLGIIENFGFRQLTTWWRLKGTYDFMRGKGGWGAMTRTGFSAK